MIQVMKANSYEDAKKAFNILKNKGPVVAVETEYGNEYFGKKDGAEIELLHHGVNQNSYPAAQAYYMDPNYDPLKKYDNFIVSHIDLDTIFGIAWAAGFFKKTPVTIALSELISQVDQYGFAWFMKNKYGKIDPIIEGKFLMIGFLIGSWKFKESNELIDISKDVHKLILRIKDVVINKQFDAEIELAKENLEEYLDFKEKIYKKTIQQDLSIPGILNVFISNKPVLDAYYWEAGCDIIIQYNTGSGSITLATKDIETAKEYFGEEGVLAPIKIFFGENAGGRVNIAGSDRKLHLQIEYLEAFVKFIRRCYLNY